MFSRTWALLLLLFFLLAVPGLFAQEEQEPPPFDIDWIDFEATVYARGDRTFTISLGMIFPTVFSGPGIVENNHHLSPGGTGSLSFNYFLTPNIFVGGELSGMFSATRGGHMLFAIPFGVRAGYQFVYRRFEFPISLMVGAAPQMMLEYRYFGLAVKPGVAAFWRFNADWSFGLNAVWWFLPQWASRDEIDRSVFANFMVATLSARYHF